MEGKEKIAGGWAVTMRVKSSFSRKGEAKRWVAGK